MANSEGTKTIRNTTIPSNWEVRQLGKIAKVTSGGTPSRGNKSYWGGDIPWITTSLIDFNEIESAEQFITEEGLKESATKLFPAGTLLMALYGQGVTRGKIAILNIEATINQACAAIILDEKQADKQFVFQYLVSKYEDIRKLSNTGNQENLNGELVKSICLNLPPLPEQRAIAHILGLMDSAINANNQLIAQKELRKKWLMQNLLTGKKRMKGFDGEWKSEILGNLIELQHGYQFRDEDFVKEGIPVIKIRNVIGYQLVLTEMTFVDYNRLEEFKSVVIQNGDLLMSLTGNIGRVVEVEGVGKPMFQNYRVGKFTPKNNQITKSFLKFLLSSNVLFRQFNGLANQSAQANFGKQDMDKLKFRFPTSIKEQTAIAQVLQAADKEIQLLKTKTEKLREQKKGMMQVLLTGKKRLTIKHK